MCLFFDGYLATVDLLFGECFIADVASISSLASALLSRLCWLHGRCFATEVALVSSLAYAFIVVVARSSSHLIWWMFCHRSYDFSVEIIVLMSIFVTGLVCMGVGLLL